MIFSENRFPLFVIMGSHCIALDAVLGTLATQGYTARTIAMGSQGGVTAAVAQMRADWGVAIKPVADLYGLAFIPIAPEDYDFLLVESRRDRPAVRAFLAALRDDATRAQIRALGMRPADA